MLLAFQSAIQIVYFDSSSFFSVLLNQPHFKIMCFVSEQKIAGSPPQVPHVCVRVHMCAQVCVNKCVGVSIGIVYKKVIDTLTHTQMFPSFLNYLASELSLGFLCLLFYLLKIFCCHFSQQDLQTEQSESCFQ